MGRLSDVPLWHSPARFLAPKETLEMDVQMVDTIYAEGLRIAAVGIGGVFINLIIVMLFVQ